MNVEQFFDTELVEQIKEAITYAYQSTKEERIALANILRDKAKQEEKEIVKITLITLAEHIESLEVSE